MSLRTVSLSAASALLLASGLAQAADITPNGLTLTPAAMPGSRFEALNPDIPSDPAFTAGQASATAISPDGKILLVLTSGFNRMWNDHGGFDPARSNEYVFVYDVTGPAPVKTQVLQIANSFIGLAWAPKGDRFFVSGGVDDRVQEYVRSAKGWGAGRVFALGHHAGAGLAVKPMAAGLAVSPDGARLLVANIQNDSVSLIDLATGAVTEQDLRPGLIDPARSGTAGGTFPRSVIWDGPQRAFVATERDREVIALDVATTGIKVAKRIRTQGQPVALAYGNPGRLYAALDNTDAVAVIDTVRLKVIELIPSAAPKALIKPGLGGAGTNALALSTDGRTLLAANGGENALAVIRLSDRAAGVRSKATKGREDDDDDRAKAPASEVVGLIPTGWYPTGVAVRRDGRRIYVVNGKSPPGPNRENCRDRLDSTRSAEWPCKAQNQYVWQLEKAGLLTLPAPNPSALAAMTQQVARNNHLLDAPTAEDRSVMAFLRGHIRHVIYIVKENRSYDQVLGDLEVGNGDPKLALFGRGLTPNLHALARDFVDLDNFYDSGESSNTGWNWTVAARTNDWTEREAPVNYADRGLQYDQEGDNRNLNVGYATAAERQAANPLTPRDPNLLVGARDVAAPDGPNGDEGKGYLWDQALAAGLKVRNWGFYGDLSPYFEAAGPYRTPLLREPWKSGTRVFNPAKASLMAITDPYFRGFDQSFPDYWRFKEWEREFDGFVASGEAPNLMMLRLAHDHTGEFGKGLDGVTTVETEVADNDWAVGLVIDKVAHSRFAADTLIFVVEDDAQDGPDHVDAHRSVAFVAGPYVKRSAVVSDRYHTVDMIRTMEEILGLGPMGLGDGLARPMTQVFDIKVADWTFNARPSAILRETALPLPPQTVSQAKPCPIRTRSAAWWAAAMAGQNFQEEDRLNTPAYNRALWRGMKGDAPYPTVRDGRDLSVNRPAVLAAAGVADCD